MNKKVMIFTRKQLIDLPQIIAEKQSRKLWTHFFILDSKNLKILQFFRRVVEKNRLHEQFVAWEEKKQ